MIYKLNNQQLNGPFTHNGIKYPANWCKLATPVQLAELGITSETTIIQSPSISELKAIKIEAINAERDLREVSGFTYLGKVFDSDERSTDRIQIAALAAQAAITTGNEYSVNWTTADNSVITLDAPGVLGMVVAFAQHGSQLHETAKTLKAQAASATTAAQLEQIVWPS